jgi:hypothetical protein
MLSNISIAKNDIQKIKFEPKNRQTERANFRYHLQAGEIIYSISYLNNLVLQCFLKSLSHCNFVLIKIPHE